MNDGVPRVLLIDGDAASRSALRMRLEERGRVQVIGEAARADEVWPLAASLQPDVAVAAGVAGGDVGLLCQQLRHLYPHLACVAVCSPAESGWEGLLRGLGVWVVPKPVQPEWIEMVAVHVQAAGGRETPAGSSGPLSADAARAPGEPLDPPNAASHSTPHHLITVYGPKGGVGKTFLSRELAIHFAAQKREGRPLRVLAVDFNLDLGTFATTLNLPRTPSLFNWVQSIDEQLRLRAVREGKNLDRMSEEEWEDFAATMRLDPREAEKYAVVHPDSGLYVLTSPREIRHSFDIRNYHLYVILDALKRSRFDVILIDTAPDTTDATIQALFFAEKVVMVGNPVVDAIENIHRLLKLLREAEYPEERIHICINRMQRREMFTLEEMRAYFQLHPSRPMFSIPDDEEVKRSVNTGVPLMLSPGRSAVKEALESIGAALVPPQGSRRPQLTGLPRKERFSLWKWLTKRGDNR